MITNFKINLTPSISPHHNKLLDIILNSTANFLRHSVFVSIHFAYSVFDRQFKGTMHKYKLYNTNDLPQIGGSGFERIFL